MPPLIEFTEPVQQYNQHQQEQQLQEYIQVYELQPEPLPSHQQQQQHQQQQPHPATTTRYQQVPAHSWGTDGWTATYLAVPKALHQGLPTRPMSPPFRPVISSVQSLV